MGWSLYGRQQINHGCKRITLIQKNRNEILVTGANGFFGAALVDYLEQQGREVLAGTRNGSSTGHEKFLAYGKLPEIADISARLSSVKTIVHCAARVHVLKEGSVDPLSLFREVNRDGTLALAKQALNASVKRFVFISTIGVNGDATHGTAFSARDIPAPHSPYAVSKLEAETGLLELAANSALEVVIIRAPLILGRNPVGNLATIASLLSRGLPLPFGAATTNRRSLVSTNTLCSLVETCLDHPKATRNVFMAADANPMHTRAIIERVARETGQKARLFPVPTSLLSALLKITGKSKLESQLFGDLEVDISQTVSRLGWSPEQ